jgi:hypothetical protein
MKPRAVVDEITSSGTILCSIENATGLDCRAKSCVAPFVDIFKVDKELL